MKRGEFQGLSVLLPGVPHVHGLDVFDPHEAMEKTPSPKRNGSYKITGLDIPYTTFPTQRTTR